MKLIFQSYKYNIPNHSIRLCKNPEFFGTLLNRSPIFHKTTKGRVKMCNVPLSYPVEVHFLEVNVHVKVKSEHVCALSGENQLIEDVSRFYSYP